MKSAKLIAKYLFLNHASSFFKSKDEFRYEQNEFMYRLKSYLKMHFIVLKHISN